jgi:phytoene dehydrogenase-like protein
MGAIPQVLDCAFKRYGGKVFLDSKIEKIVIKDGHVCGVDVQRQGRIETGCVISTVSPMLTFSALMHAEHAPAAMRRKLRRARLSHRAVSLQFGVSNRIQARGHLTAVLPPMERQGEIFRQDEQSVMWPTFFVPTLTMPELARSGGSVIEMFHPVRQNMAWDESRKKQLTASAIRALERYHHLEIAVTRVRSPKDLLDGLNLYDGRVYGLSPASGPTEYFAQRTPLRGLYLGGQCTYPGYGVAASLMSGIFAAEGLLQGT